LEAATPLVLQAPPAKHRERRPRSAVLLPANAPPRRGGVDAGKLLEGRGGVNCISKQCYSCHGHRQAAAAGRMRAKRTRPGESGDGAAERRAKGAEVRDRINTIGPFFGPQPKRMEDRRRKMRGERGMRSAERGKER
jgi:hypothetical protein